MDVLKIIEACRKDDYAILEKGLNETKICLSGSIFYSMPPGFWLDAPLTAAAKNRSRECIRILLKRGANPDCSSRNKDGTIGLTAREIAPDLFD